MLLVLFWRRFLIALFDRLLDLWMVDHVEWKATWWKFTFWLKTVLFASLRLAKIYSWRLSRTGISVQTHVESASIFLLESIIRVTLRWQTVISWTTFLRNLFLGMILNGSFCLVFEKLFQFSQLKWIEISGLILSFNKRLLMNWTQILACHSKSSLWFAHLVFALFPVSSILVIVLNRESEDTN